MPFSISGQKEENRIMEKSPHFGEETYQNAAKKRQIQELDSFDL